MARICKKVLFFSRVYFPLINFYLITPTKNRYSSQIFRFFQIQEQIFILRYDNLGLITSYLVLFFFLLFSRAIFNNIYSAGSKQLTCAGKQAELPAVIKFPTPKISQDVEEIALLQQK